MANIKQLKQHEEVFYPVTVGDAVIFDNGQTINEKIEEIEEDVASLSGQETPTLPDMGDYMLAEVYQDDEEVIAAAFNDLNTRLINIARELNNKIDTLDNRIYRTGAILDLTGENNPNYTVNNNDEAVLNETCFNAVVNNKISIVLAELPSGQPVPLFAVANPLDENGNALQGKHEFVLLSISAGNMSEGGRYFDAQSTINWYNAFYGLLIDNTTGIISEIPWSNVEPDTPDEPDIPDEPIEPEPMEET